MKKTPWLLALAITAALAACSSSDRNTDRPGGGDRAAKPVAATSNEAIPPIPGAAAPTRLTSAPVDITPELRDRLNAAARKVFPADAVVSEVGVTPIPGLVEFVVNGNIFYATENVDYLIQGNVLQVDNMVSLTDTKRTQLRKVAMAEIDDKDAIVFGPKDAKYHVTVFTDVDCGYCRKLHDERAAYAAEGIALHYLPYPRSGISEDPSNVTGLKLRQVWCSKDRQAALTDSKGGKDLASVKVEAECAAPVSKYYNLGGQIGVNGTPAIFAADGTQLGGYLPAVPMREALERMANGGTAAGAPPPPPPGA